LHRITVIFAQFDSVVNKFGRARGADRGDHPATFLDLCLRALSIPARDGRFLRKVSAQSKEPFIPLGEIRHKSGKVVYAWAFSGNCDLSKIKSNVFEMEWPPKSGQMKQFPEIDKADFFDMTRVKDKILPVEEPFVTRLAETFPAGHKAQESVITSSQTLLGL